MTRGWILAGGRSSRYGSDKALATLDGGAFAARVAASMRDAGAADVTLVGATPMVASALGLPAIGDEEAGQGPLGGIRTALRATGAARAWIAACDLPLLTRDTWLALDGALDGAHGGSCVSVATDGRATAWLVIAARAPEALAVVDAAWEAGVRAPHRALADAVRVTRPETELRNVNRPDEVPGRP